MSSAPESNQSNFPIWYHLIILVLFLGYEFAIYTANSNPVQKNDAAQETSASDDSAKSDADNSGEASGTTDYLRSRFAPRLVLVLLMAEVCRRAGSLISALSLIMGLFTIYEVNFNTLSPQSALAVFVLLGLVLCFLTSKQAEVAKTGWLRFVPRVPDALFKPMNYFLAILAAVCCAHVIIQVEPEFQAFWFNGDSLGNRAGSETNFDLFIGGIGILLILESTRRSIGAIVPALAFFFVAHSYYCYLSSTGNLPSLPDWMLPHSGQTLSDLSADVFLQSSGVFGPAATVMFKYVFLFVVFGAFLEMSGATGFIIQFSDRVFGRVTGGPAMVSVLGSALMGTLSGSAVANAVTTGNFTIPMMTKAGFKPPVAGGITAAAAAGGALVPPVMGAGAYMILEFVEGAQFLEVARAALIPAILYYFSILLIVFLTAKRQAPDNEVNEPIVDTDLGVRFGIVKLIKELFVSLFKSLFEFDGLVFFAALGSLIGLLFVATPFRAVTGSLVVILVLTVFRPQLNLSAMARGLALACFLVGTAVHFCAYGEFNVFADASEQLTEPTLLKYFNALVESSIIGMLSMLVFGMLHPGWNKLLIDVFGKSARNGIALVAASACVGIIIGVVQATGIANDFNSNIKDIVESSRLAALLGIMCCSLVLGMGVPSVVCYLLVATLMSDVLKGLGVEPLAAHLFIFYFGMMSMVTPPVALAAYASASIAKAKIMPTAFHAFRFSLVGFTLPFMFIYRPALLLMANERGGTLLMTDLVWAIIAAVLGIIALAVGLTGQMFNQADGKTRALAFISAVCLLLPDLQIGGLETIAGLSPGLLVNLIGVVLLGVTAAMNYSAKPAEKS